MKPEIVIYVFADTEAAMHFGRECQARLVKEYGDGTADLTLLPDPPRPGETEVHLAKRPKMTEAYLNRAGVPVRKERIGRDQCWYRGPATGAAH